MQATDSMAIMHCSRVQHPRLALHSSIYICSRGWQPVMKTHVSIGVRVRCWCLSKRTSHDRQSLQNASTTLMLSITIERLQTVQAPHVQGSLPKLQHPALHPLRPVLHSTCIAVQHKHLYQLDGTTGVASCPSAHMHTFQDKHQGCSSGAAGLAAVKPSSARLLLVKFC